MTDTPFPPLAQLLVKTACRELVRQTAALADQGNFDAMAAQFSADAMLQRPGGEPLHGREAILAAYAQSAPTRIGLHMILGTRFIAVAPEHAEAITQVQVWHAQSTDEIGPFGRPARGRELVGHFHDHFRLDDGHWRISHRVAAFDMHIPLD